MTKVYDDNDGDIDGAEYDYDRSQEEIMQEGSELFKELMRYS